MTIENLEGYTAGDLIAELTNRTAFAGVIVWHDSDAKDGRLEHGGIEITKSPPPSRVGVQNLLETGLSMLPRLYEDQEPQDQPA